MRPAPPQRGRVLGDQVDVEALGDRQLVPWVGHALPVRFAHAYTRDETRQLQLARRLAKRRRSQQHRLKCPGRGHDACELELDGQLVGSCAHLRDVRVQPVHERGEDALALRVIARELGIVERAAIHQQSRLPIAIQRSRAPGSPTVGLRAGAATFRAATAGPDPSRSLGQRTGRRCCARRCAARPSGRERLPPAPAARAPPGSPRSVQRDCRASPFSSPALSPACWLRTPGGASTQSPSNTMPPTRRARRARRSRSP